MNRLQLDGKAALDKIYAAGLLPVDLQGKYEAKKLTVSYNELYQKVEMANTGSQNGVALFDENTIPDYGVTNMNKQNEMPSHFIWMATKARIAKVARTANLNPVTPEEIKAAQFFNENFAWDGSVQVPNIILNAEFAVAVDGNKKFGHSTRAFFLNNREKQGIDGANEDAIVLPNNFLYLQPGQKIQPTIFLPKMVTIPNTGVAQAGNVKYVWETYYIGFEIVERK